MTMMVNSISPNVRFGNSAGTQNILERPGKYSGQPQQPEVSPEAAGEKKSSGSGKKVLGTIATLAVIAGVLVALPKVFPNAIKALSKEDLANAKIMQKAGHYLAKTGETIAKYTYEPVANLVKKWTKKAPKPDAAA